MNPLIQLKQTTAVFLVAFGLSSAMLAVIPAPDGGYPGGNTAEGQNALLGLSSGTYNTRVGVFSLQSNNTGKFNTALGAAKLLTNTADQNTATGAGAAFKQHDWNLKHGQWRVSRSLATRAAASIQRLALMRS